jgi:hypothetical protein
MLPMDHFVSSQQHVAAVKRCPVLHFSVVIFIWSFGIIDASTIKCWELKTAQAGAAGCEGCCTLHCLSCTDSIKPSLQFSCNYDNVVINVSEGSLSFQIFYSFPVDSSVLHSCFALQKMWLSLPWIMYYVYNYVKPCYHNISIRDCILFIFILNVLIHCAKDNMISFACIMIITIVCLFLFLITSILSFVHIGYLFKAYVLYC